MSDCKHLDCPVKAYDGKKVQGCSRVDCGINSPKCSRCELIFVPNKFDVCTHCQPIQCDNCNKTITRGMKVEYGEFWCFDCLTHRSEDGPALHKNRALHNSISKNPISKSSKCCRGCGIKLNSSTAKFPKDNFCVVCIAKISNNICVQCGNKWEEEGADDTGKCMKCSILDSIDKKYDVENITDVPIDRKVEGICPNCQEEWILPGEALCRECLTKLPYG